MTKGTGYAIALAVAMPTDLRNGFLGKNATQIQTAIQMRFSLTAADLMQIDTTQLLDADGFLDTNPRAVARFIGAAIGYTGTACPSDSDLSKIVTALQSVTW
jgi:hypothetical protein